MEGLSVLIGVLGGLSVSVERVVELCKGIITSLGDKEGMTEVWDRRRRGILQAIGVVAGAIITLLSYDMVSPALEKLLSPEAVAGNKAGICIIMGILSSGGSGFWNSSMRLVEEFKNAKKKQARQ